MSKKIQRGILQGDSLSPLFFVLCMDPLSRKLNEKYTKVTLQTDAESYFTKHLLFIDDLKLLEKDSQKLEDMSEKVKKFVNNLEFKINKEKSPTNDLSCGESATLIRGVRISTRSSFEEVQSKLLSRVERLCHTRYNAKILFSAINQHAISLINYHIGLLRLESAGFSKLDDAVRAVLRLYFPRTELGRGLHSVELRSEHMLLQLLDCLEKSKEISTKQAAILKVENNNNPHLAQIKGFLKVKYRLVEEV
ncbi:reverse transcriptase, partial [Hamiltosporidium tvaerminnensis]